jgi:ABC-type transport system involved in cytochrome bd biosynthesis fused ATPase/permease subunit
LWKLAAITSFKEVNFPTLIFLVIFLTSMIEALVFFITLLLLPLVITIITTTNTLPDSDFRKQNNGTNHEWPWMKKMNNMKNT